MRSSLVLNYDRESRGYEVTLTFQSSYKPQVENRVLISEDDVVMDKLESLIAMTIDDLKKAVEQDKNKFNEQGKLIKELNLKRSTSNAY